MPNSGAVEKLGSELAPFAERSTIHCDAWIGAGPAGLTALFMPQEADFSPLCWIPESREGQWPPHIRWQTIQDKQGVRGLDLVRARTSGSGLPGPD